MIDAHRDLGELIVIVYLGIALASLMLAQREGLPAWLTGTAHALLGVQIILGIILYVEHPHAVPWTHPLFAALAVVSVGLMVPLRRRFGRNTGTAISSLLAGIFAVVAVVIAVTH